MTSFYVAMRNTFFLIFTMIFHLDVLMAGGEHPDFVNLYQRILDRQDDPNQLNNWIVDGYERALKDAELKKEQVRSASLGLTVDYYAELGGSENEVLGRSERAAVGLSLSMPVPIKALSTQAQNQVAQEDIRLKIAGATKAEAERLFIYNFAQSLIRISEREAQFFFAHSNLDVLERYHEKIKGLKESNYRAKFPNKNDEEIADLLHFDSELVNLEANIADQDLAVRQLLIDFNIEKRVFSEQIYQGEFSCEYIVNPFNDLSGLEFPDRGLVLAQARLNNSQWQIADLNEELVQLEKAGAVAQWLPQARFSVGPEVSHQTYLPDTEPLSGYGVSARISISGRLLGGGSRKQYERTLNRRDGQSNQTRQIRAQVEEGIRAEFDQIQQLRNELDVQRKNFERRKLLVSKLVEEDLADEDRNFTAERGAIGNYFAAAQAVVLKKHSILLSSMRLKLLAGTLSSEDLNTFQSFFINHKVILEQFNDDDDDTKFKLLGTPIDEIADVVL